MNPPARTLPPLRLPWPLLAGLLIFLPAARVPAQDSAPKLLSKKGGGGWATVDELKRAALAGNPHACGQLGEMLLRGDQMPADPPRAIQLLEQGARGGDASAAFRIGMLLDNGEFMPRDSTRAVAYFRAAAAGGVGEAFHNLGAAYASARGVPRDHIEALGWLILAKKNGAPSDAEARLRDHIRELKHPDWLAAGEKRAPAIERELAQGNVAGFLPPPPGTPPPARPAAVLTAPPVPSPIPVSEKISPSAPARPTLAPPTVVAAPAFDLPGRIGSGLDTVAGLPVNVLTPTGRRLDWPNLDALRRAADTGDSSALSALGQVLLAGEVVPADAPRAVVVLERAAQAGSIDAAIQLADLYAKGTKIPRSPEKALAYNLQAARGGSVQAIFNVGACYANGLGTAPNHPESLAWLIVAKRQGADFGDEQRVRAYLVKNAPDQIAAAERRAGEIEREIAKGPARK